MWNISNSKIFKNFQSFSSNKQFIACQGPKGNPDSTIAEFWQMALENKVTHIIMVANFIESGKVWSNFYQFIFV